MKVDFPSPLAPTRPMCSPFNKRKDTSSKIARSPKPWLKFFTSKILMLDSLSLISLVWLYHLHCKMKREPNSLFSSRYFIPLVLKKDLIGRPDAAIQSCNSWLVGVSVTIFWLWNSHWRPSNSDLAFRQVEHFGYSIKVYIDFISPSR